VRGRPGVGLQRRERWPRADAVPSRTTPDGASEGMAVHMDEAGAVTGSGESEAIMAWS
jgi:hypothetical protein